VDARIEREANMSTKDKIGLQAAGRIVSMASVLILLISSVAAAAPDHSFFGELLTKYNQAGVVNYAGFKSEESKLDEYLDQLSNIDPETLSSSDRFAFYVSKIFK